MKIQKCFGAFSRSVSKAVGSPYAFALALACVITWAALDALQARYHAILSRAHRQPGRGKSNAGAAAR